MITDGLQTALNEIRETLIQDNTLYQEQIPLVNHYTSSQVYGQSLLALPSDLRNKFINSLVNRIAYTKFVMNYFRNPLRDLQNDELPLGAIGQEIYINPARGRVYDIDDFAGLLAKYESDVKTEYSEINFDVQYPVTIVRRELEKAFTSWTDFENFLSGISTSLYNGAYIDDYKYTKKLITNAYRNNAVQMEVFSFSNPSAPTDTELKNLIAKLREMYLNFMTPSTKYNAWSKVGGYGRSIVSWSNPEDIVVFVNNKMASIIDVDVLSVAFNMDKTSLLGKIYYVEDFSEYNDEGVMTYDGSNIYALICDRRWFKIRNKAMFMDEFYNASNRSWQQFLNVIKAFNYSLFANAYMLVGAIPSIASTAIQFNDSSVAISGAKKVLAKITTTPFNSTDTITFTSSDTLETYVKITKVDNRTVEIQSVSNTSDAVTITASNGSVSGTVSVTVSGIA